MDIIAIAFHEDADAMGSVASQGLKRTQAVGILDLRLSKTTPYRVQIEAKNDLPLTHSIRKSSSEKRLGPKRNRPSKSIPLSYEGGRISGDDCVQGTEAGREVDQSSPTTSTLPRSNTTILMPRNHG